MNFVAHAYLSFKDSEFLFGNFCGDMLKRDSIAKLQPRMKQGFEAHLFIDEFTDKHDSFRELRSLLFPTFGHYASVVIDLYYDYALVADWKSYSNQPYLSFVKQVHEELFLHASSMDTRTRMILERLVSGQWMERAFLDMSRRTEGAKVMRDAATYLVQHEEKVMGAFREFFPMLVQEVKTRYF